MCAVEVFKYLNGLAPPDIAEYFWHVTHRKATCGIELSLLVPRVKSGVGWKTFAFQGAKYLKKIPDKLKSETTKIHHPNSSI